MRYYLTAICRDCGRPLPVSYKKAEVNGWGTPVLHVFIPCEGCGCERFDVRTVSEEELVPHQPQAAGGAPVVRPGLPPNNFN